MKSFFARIFLFSLTLSSAFAFAQSGELGPITEAEISAAIAGKSEAIARAKSGLGQRYCTAVGGGGIRFYLDSQVRISFLFPSVDGVERGMEAPGLVQTLKTMNMVKEVSQTFQMYGIQGRVADQVTVINSTSYEAGQPLTTFAVLGFYIDEKGNIDRGNSILLLTDQRNGTFFVGSTKFCK